MENEKLIFKTVDAYIASFPETIQKVLHDIRETIHTAAPQAVEKISYQMPAFSHNGNLIYYAAFKNHIGVFGISGAVEAFHDELSPFAGPKGNLQFPINKPIPLHLIHKIVTFRLAENNKKAAMKKGK